MRHVLTEAFDDWSKWVNLLHHFFADPFLRGFCGHIFLPGVLLLLLALMFGKLGTHRFGIPRLFWHENWAKQFFVGVTLFWLYGNVVFVGYALERRPQPELVPNDSQLSEAGDTEGKTVQYRPRPSFAERVHLPADWDPLASYFFGITLSVSYVLLCLCVGVGIALAFLLVFAILLGMLQLVIPGLRPSTTAHRPQLVAVGRTLIFIPAVVGVFLLLTYEPIRPLLLLAGSALFVLLFPPLIVILARADRGGDHPHYDSTPKLVWLFITGIPGIFLLQCGALLLIHGPHRTALILFAIAAGILVLAALGPWLRSRLSGTAASAAAHRSWGGWPLLLGMGSGFALLVAILYMIQPQTQLRSTLESIGGAAANLLSKLGVSGSGMPAPGSPGIHAYGLILLSIGTSFLFYGTVWVFRRWFSPAVAFLFLVKVCVVLYALIAYGLTTPWGSFSVLLVIVLLVLFVWGSAPKFKVRLPEPYFHQFYPKINLLWQRVFGGGREQGEGNRYPEPELEAAKLRQQEKAEQEEGKPSVPRLRNGEELGRNWQGKPPVAIVCVSGGGIRAAAWTTAVLGRIEKQFNEIGVCLPHHILLMTGASGGMVGAAAYAATVEVPGDGGAPADRAALLDHLAENFRDRDYLTPVVYQMVYHDLLRAFIPGPLDRDRGWALENAWKEHLKLPPDQDALLGGKAPLERTFADLYEGEAAGRRPHLIFSPMMIEDGRQLLISNLDLASMVENRGNMLSRGGAAQQTLSRESLEFFELFPGSEGKLHLSTAARMSASFPIVSPAVELPTNPRRRVVDAGYYDNFGVNLASAWIFNYREWLRAKTSGVVVIQIRDSLTEAERRMDHIPKDQSSPLGRSFAGLTGMVEALLSAREASSGFRNDDRIGLLSEHFLQDRTLDKDFFTSVVFEFRYPHEEVSLSWCLMDDEREKIETDAERLAESKKLQALCEWWQARHGAKV